MAEDRYERYYAEKLWELIPPVYRHEDGLAEPPDVLRSLVEVVAGQAAVLRRSQDRLWEDQTVEGADDWAVPYLADLVATRLVSALNPRGRRIDVAKTIYYRRRKGTLAVLEELISDIAAWDGVVVEAFRRLSRTWHALDPEPAPLAGRVTGTLPGGLPDLRRAAGAEAAHGAFEEYHHLPDVRRPRGRDGRYGISRLPVHLWRVPSFRVAPDGAAVAGGAGRFTACPSGRDTALFGFRSRPERWEEWRAAREWEVTAPLRCRILEDVEYVLTEEVVLRLLDDGVINAARADELRTLRGTRYTREARLRQTLGTLPSAAFFLTPAVLHALRAAALREDCGKAGILPAALRVEVGGVEVPREAIVGADLGAWSVPAAVDATLVVDPARGRLLFPGGAPGGELRITHRCGFPGEAGAGGYDRRAVEALEPDVVHAGGGALNAAALPLGGVARIDDDLTYGPVANRLAITDMMVAAANQRRPFLLLQGAWRLGTGAHEDSLLTLDGLWIGSAAGTEVRLEGDFERVVLRSCTLDPGGRVTRDDGAPVLDPVVLEVRGHVEVLELDRCVAGPIRVSGVGMVERLVVRDSVLQSLDDAIPAIDLEAAEITLERVTVLGGLRGRRLWATEAILTRPARVLDVQRGCFRFGAYPEGSRLPHPYESHILEDLGHLFTSRRFGDWGYAQLSESAPLPLRRGAENGSEMGAWSARLDPVRLDGLRAKIDEYIPFGRLAVLIRES